MNVNFGQEQFNTQFNTDTSLNVSESVIQDINVGLDIDDGFTAEMSAEEDFVCSMGSSIPSGDYDGPYEVTPKAYEEQILYTANKTMAQNVTIHEVPYYETPNTDGNTVYIASEV